MADNNNVTPQDGPTLPDENVETIPGEENTQNIQESESTIPGEENTENIQESESDEEYSKEDFHKLLCALSPGNHINYDKLLKEGHTIGLYYLVAEFLQKRGMVVTAAELREVASLDHESLIPGYLAEVPGPGCLKGLWFACWCDPDATSAMLRENLLYYVYHFLEGDEALNSAQVCFEEEFTASGGNLEVMALVPAHPRHGLERWWNKIHPHDEFRSISCVWTVEEVNSFPYLTDSCLLVLQVANRYLVKSQNLQTLPF